MNPSVASFAVVAESAESKYTCAIFTRVPSGLGWGDHVTCTVLNPWYCWNSTDSTSLVTSWGRFVHSSLGEGCCAGCGIDVGVDTAHEALALELGWKRDGHARVSCFGGASSSSSSISISSSESSSADFSRFACLPSAPSSSLDLFPFCTIELALAAFGGTKSGSSRESVAWDFVFAYAIR